MNLKKQIYISKANFDIVMAGGSVNIGGETISYSDEYEFLVEFNPDGVRVGKFLSGWDCATGLPVTDPGSIPYVYTTGDYYIVKNLAAEGSTNYSPAGTSYEGTASIVPFASGDVPHLNDLIFFDGTSWILLLTSRTLCRGLVIEAETNKTVNGYQVPSLSDSQLLAIYNAIVAGVPVTITDATGMMHFTGINADMVSDEIFVSFIYFTTMILEYGEGGATTYKAIE